MVSSLEEVKIADYASFSYYFLVNIQLVANLYFSLLKIIYITHNVLKSLYKEGNIYMETFCLIMDYLYQIMEAYSKIQEKEVINLNS